MAPRRKGTTLAAAGLAAALLAAGCGGDDTPGPDTLTDPPPPTTEAATEPETSILMTASDRPEPNLSVPEWGARSTLTIRATRDGEWLAGERVELLADPFPYGEGEERVVARGRTSGDGKALRLKARFDRDTRVRARIGDATSESLDLLRGVRTRGGDVDELPGDRITFTGRMTYPRDIDPRVRFAVFIGRSDRPRLPRADVRPKQTRLGKGSTRVAFTAPVPGDGWRLQVCLVPAADSGLSGPPGGCRGRTIPNSELREQRRAERREERELRERKRAERRADQGG